MVDPVPRRWITALVAAVATGATAGASLTACTHSGSTSDAPAGSTAGSVGTGTGSSSNGAATDVGAVLDDVIAHTKILAPHYDLSVPGGIVLVAQDGQV